MKNRISINKIIDLFGVLVALCFFNPWFSVTPHYIIITCIFIWALLVIVSGRGTISGILWDNNGIFFAVICLMVRLSAVVLGKAFINAHDILLIFILAFGSYYFEQNVDRLKEIILSCTVYIVMISVVTLFRLRSNPVLCRLLARGDDAIHLENGSVFTASAATITAFVILFVLFAGTLVYYKKRSCLLLTVLLLYLIFKSQFTIALATSVMFAVCEVVLMDDKNLNRIFMFILLFLLAVILFANMEEISKAILSVVSETEWSFRRIDELLTILSQKSIGSGDVAKRLSLTFSSLRSFFENPLLGHGMRNVDFMNSIGGHSTFFDMLGSFGLLGGGSYIMCFVCSFLFYKSRFKGGAKRLYIITMLCYFFLSIVNTTQNVVIYFVILFYIPSAIKILSVNNKKYKKSVVFSGGVYEKIAFEKN